MFEFRDCHYFIYSSLYTLTLLNLITRQVNFLLNIHKTWPTAHLWGQSYVVSFVSSKPVLCLIFVITAYSTIRTHFQCYYFLTSQHPHNFASEFISLQYLYLGSCSNSFGFPMHSTSYYVWPFDFTQISSAYKMTWLSTYMVYMLYQCVHNLHTEYFKICWSENYAFSIMSLLLFNGTIQSQWSKVRSQWCVWLSSNLSLLGGNPDHL